MHSEPSYSYSVKRYSYSYSKTQIDRVRVPLEAEYEYEHEHEHETQRLSRFVVFEKEDMCIVFHTLNVNSERENIGS